MKRGERKLASCRPILLHLPEDMLKQLDAAADLFGMYRAEVIRRSLDRELSTLLGEELRRVERVVLKKTVPRSENAKDLKNKRGRWRWLKGLISVD